MFSEANAQVAGTPVTIAGISVEGNKNSDSETIIALSGLRPGMTIKIPGDEVTKAIRTLWRRKQFSDIEIDVDRVTEAGVFLIIKVKEFPKLSKISVENNDEISDDEVKKEIGKAYGDIISGYDVYLAEQKIKKLYEDEGLMFAKVDGKLVDTDSSDFSNLIFEVEEGVEFYVSDVQFIGNKHFDDDELSDAFDDTHTKSWWQFWRSSKFDKKEYEKDLDLLRQFFKRQGYIDARILSDSLVYNEESGTVKVIVSVDEGVRSYIRNIVYKGNTVYPTELLMKRLDFKKGDIYDLERFEMNLRQNEEQSDVSSLYMNNGYLMVRFDKDEERVGEDSVDITINIYEGDRIKIRRVNIVGNTKTKDKVIRRELYTYPGDYFNRAAIIRSIKALGAIQYFNPEALQSGFQIKPVDNTSVDLEYKVEEQSTDTFNASVGYAGSFGLTGSIGMTFNNFSITEPLQGGGGQILNFTWEFGTAGSYRTFSLGLTEPWLFDEPTTVGFNIFDTKYDWLYKYSQTGISLNAGRRFRWPDDYFRGDLSLVLKEVDVGTTSSSYYRPGHNTEISLGATISRMSLDNMFFPTSGSKFSVSNRFAMATLGLGSTDYFKSELNYEMLNPLMSIDEYNRLVFYLGTKIGYVNGFNSDTALSPIELYYMGGNGLDPRGVITLRGYDEAKIGPSQGGRVMAKTTAELRFAVTVQPMPIYIYAFAEAGNVWKNFRTADPFNLKRSAGVGVQMMMAPIGIIGVSIGYGFDNDNSGTKSGWVTLFHLGQQF